MKNITNTGGSLLTWMRTELLKAFLSLLNLPVPREKVRIAIKARCIVFCLQIRRQMVLCVL